MVNERVVYSKKEASGCQDASMFIIQQSIIMDDFGRYMCVFIEEVT